MPPPPQKDCCLKSLPRSARPRILLSSSRPLCFCDSCLRELLSSRRIGHRKPFDPHSVKMTPGALQDLVTGRKVLLRDFFPRPIADVIDRLPIPRVLLPILNLYPYPDTRPESNPRRAASRILASTNSYRRKYGKNSLRLSGTLCEVARQHSTDQATRRNMSHIGAHGSTLSDRLVKNGYRYRLAGENVAFGYMNEEHVFNGWRTSSGHRANLLRDGVDEMGVWVVKGRDGLYWTQILARRR